MGKQFHIETRTMKFLVVLALVAAAYAAPEAEANADPAYFYGNYYGYPSYYSGYGYSGYASPYWGGYYNRGYGYWKREAGAEPEAKADASADPAYWYGNYGWAAHTTTPTATTPTTGSGRGALMPSLRLPLMPTLRHTGTETLTVFMATDGDTLDTPGPTDTTGATGVMVATGGDFTLVNP